MKILIVEDDENKRKQIFSYFCKEFPQYEIVINKSLQSGLRSIIEEKFDLVLLDMSMPTYDVEFNEDGGHPKPYAGREILLQMKRREIKTPVIVITQFDRFGYGDNTLYLSELDKKLKSEHQENYWGAIYYNVTVESWQKELKEVLQKVSLKHPPESI